MKVAIYHQLNSVGLLAPVKGIILVHPETTASNKLSDGHHPACQLLYAFIRLPRCSSSHGSILSAESMTWLEVNWDWTIWLVAIAFNVIDRDHTYDH
jgi:hypothetical protein